MRHLRRWLGNERGFTLAELLVATAVSGIVMAAVFVLQQGGQQAYLFGASRVETQQSARVALDLMTRELRSAQSITTIASCTSGACTDLTFVDQNGQTVEYKLSGTTLNRTAGGTVTVLGGEVQSLAMAPYSVYDPSSSTYTTTTTATAVKVISIRITTQTEEAAGDQTATMESTVQLRLNLS
jgi:prepilin-type N-terminal cleavage/methylation domain-containing protein